MTLKASAWCILVMFRTLMAQKQITRNPAAIFTRISRSRKVLLKHLCPDDKLQKLPKLYKLTVEKTKLLSKRCIVSMGSCTQFLTMTLT